MLCPEAVGAVKPRRRPHVMVFNANPETASNTPSFAMGSGIAPKVKMSCLVMLRAEAEGEIPLAVDLNPPVKEGPVNSTVAMAIASVPIGYVTETRTAMKARTNTTAKGLRPASLSVLTGLVSLPVSFATG